MLISSGREAVALRQALPEGLAYVCATPAELITNMKVGSSLSVPRFVQFLVLCRSD
jgi:hypothetical protein